MRFRRHEIANSEVGLSYLENDGDGPIVVVLHGLAGTGDEFPPIRCWNTAALSRRLTRM